MEIKLMLVLLVPFIFAAIGAAIKTVYDMWLDWWQWNCSMADRKAESLITKEEL